MKRILITGAAGFISSQLAYRLYKEGNELILIDNFSYGYNDNLVFKDVDFTNSIYKKDIRDIDFLEGLFKNNKIDVVYHFAGITPLPDCQSNPIEAVDVNVRGTVILAELSRKYCVKKFIFASTSAVYENNTDFPSVEEKVEKPSLIYPSTKYTAEQFLKSYNDCYRLPITILRFANVYGPHIDCLRLQPPVVAYIIRELYFDRNPVLHSNGNQERDFIYVDDLVDIAIKVLNNNESYEVDIKNENRIEHHKMRNNFDVVNVSTGKTITINKIAEIIKNKMGKTNIKTKYADTSHYWDNYPNLFEGEYPINKKLLEKEVLKYTCLSNKHAFDVYGFKPKISIEEGLDRTILYTTELLKCK